VAKSCDLLGVRVRGRRAPVGCIPTTVPTRACNSTILFMAGIVSCFTGVCHALNSFPHRRPPAPDGNGDVPDIWLANSSGHGHYGDVRAHSGGDAGGGLGH
jgi:hypothetical protein